jgi:hypothetical protein
MIVVNVCGPEATAADIADFARGWLHYPVPPCGQCELASYPGAFKPPTSVLINKDIDRTGLWLVL